MKLTKHLGRSLMLVGFLLLAFFAAAKLHQVFLARASMRRFDSIKQASFKNRGENQFVQAVTPHPDFVLWSEKRVKHYEESLDEHVALPSAVIHINRIHVEAPVFEGTDEITLNRGVGHIPGTARFGEKGNLAIAGHRDGFFRGLKDIRIGDRIVMDEPERTETYIVDRLDIVTPDNLKVLHSSAKSVLTLVTCYPFYYIGEAPQRFIVHAVLAGSEPHGVNDLVVQAEQSSSITTSQPASR